MRSKTYHWQKLAKSGAIILILVLLLKVWFLGSFIDEQENFTAGWLIANDLVLYRDFFLHHTPLPYFVSALFFIGDIPPWWAFRLFALGYLLFIGRVIWRLVVKKFQWPILILGGLIALVAPKLNLNMLLADNFFAFSFVASLLLATSYWHFNQPTFGQVWRWTLFFSFVSGWSTIVAWPPFGLLLLVILFKEYSRVKSWQKIWQKIDRACGWFIGTMIIFPLYFWLNGAWVDFFWSTVTYNQEYYFPTRLAQNSAELAGGAFYYAYSRAATLMINQGQLIWQTSLAFLQTGKGLLLSLGGGSLAEWDQLLKVWLLSPISTLAANAWSVLGLGLWSLITVLLNRSGRQLSLFVILAGLLFMRHNEIFHLSALFMAVFWLASYYLVKSFTHRQYGRSGMLIFFFIVVITHFSQSYLELVTKRTPIVLASQIQQAKIIEEKTQPTERLQVIGGGLTAYLLSERLPAGKMLIYYAWFMPAHKLRQELITTLEARRAGLVLFEEHQALEEGRYFDLELVNTLQTNYSEAERGIYQ